MVTLLNSWITDDHDTPDLFLALLTAIPKPNRPTTIPANLRPISVTSIWYKLLAKVFCERLTPSL